MSEAMFQKSAEFDTRITMLEKSNERIGDAIISINENLKSLVRLEERHAETRGAIERAFLSIEKIESAALCLERRVVVVEAAMPGLERLRECAINMLIGVACIVGLAVVALVIK